MKAKTVKEVLTAARWIIANKGWCQGSFYRSKDGHPHCVTIPNDFGGACLTGALRLVKADVKLHGTALDYLENFLFELGGGFTLVQFNDQLAITKEDVLRFLGQAIDSLE